MCHSTAQVCRAAANQIDHKTGFDVSQQRNLNLVSRVAMRYVLENTLLYSSHRSTGAHYEENAAMAKSATKAHFVIALENSHRYRCHNNNAAELIPIPTHCFGTYEAGPAWQGYCCKATCCEALLFRGVSSL